MWRPLKPLLVGIAASVLVFAACFAFLQFAVSGATDEEVNQWGLYIYFTWAMLMLFVPSFAAGYVAKGWGIAYGLVLGSIPIVLWPIVNHGFPSLFYVPWLAVAAMGGYLGQVLGRKMHAS